MRRQANVFVNNIHAAVLEQDQDGLFMLQYQPHYLGNHMLPISLTLPLQAEKFLAKNLFPFFDGLIPEGWLLSIAEKNWKLDPRDRMGLLLAFSHDCIGNVHLEPIEVKNES